MDNAINKASEEPLAHQGYEHVSSGQIASAPYEKRNAIHGVEDPYATVAKAAFRPTHTRCSVLGCCNHAGSGRMQAIMVCMPCAQTLNTGEPGTGSTFIHLLSEALEVSQMSARREYAAQLLRTSAKRRSIELSPGAYDVAMDALVTALKEGAGPYRERPYGQAESEKSNAGFQSR